MKHALITALLFMAFISVSQGQETVTAVNDTTPFYMLSLEELMNVNVTVASHTPLTNRESPGIVTVITQDEIRKTGANDVMEVLKLVPGFDFGVDIQGIVGIGIRGNWANEGKVLMLIDGIELNEELYSTLQFGGHYPIEIISRIEIIRGPGSAIYGGNAEYAVINIITDQNSDFNGISASVSNSFMSKTFGSRGISLAAGKSVGEAHINLSTSLNQLNRSQENYTDVTGKSYSMTDESELFDGQYRLDFFLKGLSITGIYDNYVVEQKDGYDEIYSRSYKSDFNSGLISAKYDYKGIKNIIITPGIKVKFHKPWAYDKKITGDDFKQFNTHINTNEYYITSNYTPNEKINLIAGVEYYHQLARQKVDSAFFSNGSNLFNIDNYSLYAQSILKLNPLNVTLGCRYNYNPFYGFSFVPRISLTKVWEKFHIKTLYSKAFRTPSVENINASPDILPEETLVEEIEAGCRLAKRSYLTFNIYNIRTKNSIVYYYDENDLDKYKNEAASGTRGVEIDYKFKSSGWYASINYSYYSIANHSELSTYSVPGHPNNHLAFPSHKINLNCNINLSRTINVNPSLSYMSTRYSASHSDAGVLTSREISPSFYANISLNFDDVFKKGLNIQLACFNMFDNPVFYIQPYDGNHEPLPGAGRELKLKFSYSFLFKEKK